MQNRISRIKALDFSGPIPPRWHGTQYWGKWCLDGNYLINGEYVFNLENITSSAAVLDKIMQIAGKRWATPECVAGLVRALDDIFYPQSCLCSGGADKRITAAETKDKLRRASKLAERYKNEDADW